MREKSYASPWGTVIYWVSDDWDADRTTLVFLPGLTADHTLFDRQTEYFQGNYNCFVWDAPGHASSRPFRLEFSLDDKAKLLRDILSSEAVSRPVLVGQSMGGYVAQTLMELYPDYAGGFVSVDSCPLQRKYVTAAEIWALRRTEPMYLAFPWKALLKVGPGGCSETEYGRRLMADMMGQYSKAEYCRLAGHGFRMLADAMASDREYKINCPAILLCGEKDHAGSAKRYNKAWNKETGLPLCWIKGAGHNSNTDQPEAVNRIIEEFIVDALEKR